MQPGLFAFFFVFELLLVLKFLIEIFTWPEILNQISVKNLIYLC